MGASTRVVVDTNVLVSRLLVPHSSPALAMRQAEIEGQLLMSDDSMNEVADILSRSKFDRYVSLETRRSFVQRLGRIVEFVPVIQRVRECRDPKDDKFLEVALNGRADVIITGDEDLLAMHPWRGILILSPAQYMEQVRK